MRLTLLLFGGRFYLNSSLRPVELEVKVVNTFRGVEVGHPLGEEEVDHPWAEEEVDQDRLSVEAVVE